MTILTMTLPAVLHPGDLGLELWLKFFLIVVPIFLVGFIIYKVASRR